MLAKLAGEKNQKAAICLEVFNIALIIFSLIIGGGPFGWGWQTIMIVFLGVMQLNAYAFNLWLGISRLPSRRVVAVAIIMLTLVSIQMIPMPPDLWRTLPGSDAREAVLDAFGLGHIWQTISYVPADTGLVLILALVFTSLTFSVSVSEKKAKINYVMTIIAVVAIHCFIGVVQVATAGSSFAFFSTPHRGNLIGLFANKNHLALAMTAAYIYLACFIFQIKSVKLRASYAIISLILFLFLLILTNSRALIVIYFVIIIIACWDLRGFLQPKVIVMSSVVIMTLIAFLIVANPDVLSTFKRFGEIQDDNRVSMLLQSYPLLKTFWLTGSGYGTFAQVFPIFERLENVNPLYVNHVHNDWVQLLIEGGLGAALCIALFAIIVIQVRYSFDFKKVFKRSVKFEIDDLIIYASVLVIYAFIIHSFVDYPFRRGGTLVIFAVACGLAVSKLQNRLEYSPHSEQN